MTYYLVDLENTGEAWARAVQDASPGDMIYLFYSRNYMRVHMDSIGPYLDRGVGLRCKKCSTGKDGLDFQLSSELGALAARNESAGFVILSRDTGYDVLISYWAPYGIKITRRPPPVPEAKPAKKAAKKKAQAKPPEPALVLPAGCITKTQCRKAYREKLRLVMDGLEFTEADVNKLVGICVMAVEVKPVRRLLTAYNACARTYGQKSGTLIYNAAKPVLRDIMSHGPFYSEAGLAAEKKGAPPVDSGGAP